MPIIILLIKILYNTILKIYTFYIYNRLYLAPSLHRLYICYIFAFSSVLNCVFIRVTLPQLYTASWKKCGLYLASLLKVKGSKKNTNLWVFWILLAYTRVFFIEIVIETSKMKLVEMITIETYKCYRTV